MDSAVPVLPARDLGETLAFYERLGFESRGAPWQHWGYLIVARGGAELHFFGAPELDAGQSEFSCYLRTADADALQRDWAFAGARPSSVETTEYGMREFALVDPSGNLLRIGSIPA